MKVSSIQIESSPRESTVRLSAQVNYRSGASETLWFEFPSSYRDSLSESGNPWAALLLPLAMELGEDLHIEATLDSRLAEGLSELQEIWHCWYPRLKKVEVTHGGFSSLPAPSSERAASFFSGGVDSFYSALKHQPDSGAAPLARDLVFVWGFDVKLSQVEVAERLIGELETTAKELGAQLIAVATNIRETRWAETDWAHHSHGAALGAVGLCLEPRLSDLLIPSTESYQQLYAWGSHALTDPLFSTGSMRVRHDGAEASRLDKVRLLANSEVAMRSVRVCWQSDSAENCCRCQKCQRTMLQFQVIGRLQDCRAFPRNEVELARLRKVFIEWDLVPDYRDIYDLAKQQGRRDLCLSLDYAFKRSKLLELGFGAARSISKAPKGHLVAQPLRKVLRNASVR